MKYAVNVGIPAFTWTTDEDLALEDSELKGLIHDYTNNMQTQFVLGLLDIDDDAVWAEYENGLLERGLERYLEVKAEIWGVK